MPGNWKPTGAFVLKKAEPPPGKLLPVIKASLEEFVPAPPKYATGRTGQRPGPRVLMHWPTTGVQGNPVCAVRMPLSSQPPSRAPAVSCRFLKIGKSQRPDATKLRRTSKSDGPRSCRTSSGYVGFVFAVGPS